MKLALRSFAIIASITGALTLASESEIKYGPSNCILISQSHVGSCVITTDCEGVDTSKTEFGFSCVREGEDTQWHSYGNGGFDANEEFDSGLKCDECGGPSSDAVRAGSVETQMVHVEITTTVAAMEYVPAEIEAAPTTQKPLPKPQETAMVVQESWEPSVWSPMPAAMQSPPTAPVGILPGSQAHSFLRAGKQTVRVHEARSNKGSDSDAEQEMMDATRKSQNIGQSAQTTSNGDQSGTTDTSNSDSNQGSDDGYVDATIETDPAPQASQASNKQDFLKAHRSAIQVIAPQVERFGPSNCIATWKNPKGHCILQTKCDNIDMSKVDVGMICVNADGAETRHTFGKDSFDPDEEFDTMIECNKCTALRQDKTNKALTDKLQLLSEGIKDLEKGMESISANVERLNAKVFRKSALAQTHTVPIRPTRQEGEDSEGYAEASEQDEQLQLNADRQAQREEEQAEKDDEQQEEEEHQRAMEAERAERKRRECNEGNEFNQGVDC